MTPDSEVDTLAGGKEGQGQGREAPASFAGPSSAVVVTLDTCLGALSGMLACVLRPDAKGARERLDRNYETLITCLEEWRDAIPKT